MNNLRYLGGFSAALICLSLSACGTPVQGLSTVSCDELAEDAVRISEENNMGTVKPVLLKIRDSRVVSDKQPTAEAPASGEIDVLTCKGTGVFNIGVEAPVNFKMTLDSDGDYFVYYEPVL